MSENNTTAIVSRDTGELVAMDFGVQAVISIEQALTRMKELQRFVAAVMVRDEDYGIIPGTGKKPSLLKPGAEKLCEMYGLTPTFAIMASEKDWEAGFILYEVKCALVSKRTGTVAAEGVGSCNSRENRYRGRDAYTLANTILKMAKKRAHVDATLSATRSSGVFTQDVEDLAEPHEQADRRAAPTRTAQPSPRKAPTRSELTMAWAKLAERGAAVGVELEKLNQSWTEAELIEKAQHWKSRIVAAEDALAAMQAASEEGETEQS